MEIFYYVHKLNCRDTTFGRRPNHHHAAEPSEVHPLVVRIDDVIDQVRTQSGISVDSPDDLAPLNAILLMIEYLQNDGLADRVVLINVFTMPPHITNEQFDAIC